MKKIPPYGEFTIQGIIVIKRGIINIALNILLGLPNGSENPSSPNCYGELASNQVTKREVFSGLSLFRDTILNIISDKHFLALVTI